jgi:TolA-binding protein
MSDCPRRWEVDVHREGRLGSKDALSFERHLRACRECKHAKDCEQRLREIAAAVGPSEEPGDLTLRRLRSRILRDVALGAERSGPRWGAIAVAAGVVLSIAAGSAWWAHQTRATHATNVAVTAAPTATASSVVAPSREEAFAGTVAAVGEARWGQSRAGGVERVSLDEGTVSIHVRRQHVGERFLVVLPDGELEVRGTTFEVTVRAGVTTQVHVDEGIVEMRPRGSAVTRLEAGSSWAPPPAPSIATTAARAARPAATPPSAPLASAAPGVAGSDDEYATAVGLLRTGRSDEAAAALRAFVVAHPGAPQAEDASYLEAVALARAGRLDAAGLAAEHHLAGYPGSFHRKEAATLVARAASQRGDCTKALAVLRPWLSGAGDASVTAALGGCAPASAPTP